MDNIMFFLSFISTIAAVVSAIIAVKSKNEAKSILKETRIINDKSYINNKGENSGVIMGVNTGDVKNVK